MVLLLTYLAFMILGDIAAYLIGLSVEQVWPTASLPVFLVLYFLFLWVSWVIAVWITKPSVAPRPPPAEGGYCRSDGSAYFERRDSSDTGACGQAGVSDE